MSGHEWERGLDKFTLSEPCISFVVAMGTNRVIGVQGKLPWHLPEDLKRFKAITMGQPMIMGRKTYESIGRILPGRKHIVLSRSPSPIHPEVMLAHDPWDAVREAAAWLHERKKEGLPVRPEVLVIGGSEIFKLFLPLVHRINLTEVQAAPEGDAFMPEPTGKWKEAFCEPMPLAVFRVLERVL